MRLFVLDLYKFPYSSSNRIDWTSKYIQKLIDKEKLKSTFSSFDGLKICQLDKISDIINVSEFNTFWPGKRQQIFFYDSDIAAFEKLKFIDGNFYSKEKSNKTFNFIGISAVSVTKTMQRYGAEKSKKLIDFLNSCIGDMAGGNLEFQIFKTIGAYDYVIVFLADNYEHIIKATESLKYVKYEFNDEISHHILIDIFTIISLYNENCEPVNQNIRILKSERTTDLNETTTEKTEIILSGEYDVYEKTELNPSDYCPGGKYYLLGDNTNTSIFQTYSILSTTIKRTEMKTKVFSINESIDKYRVKNNFEDDINECQKLFNELIKKDLIKSSGLNIALNSIYHDFINNCCSMFSGLWTDDIIYVFPKVITVIKNIVDFANIDNNCKIKEIAKLLEHTRQFLLHISQSNKPFLQIPNTHLRYTGTYNKILYAYYGIIKEILKIAYLLPKQKEQQKQAELIPFVTLDTNATVNVEMHINYLDDAIDATEKILNFSLPTTALCDIRNNAICLGHEIWHHISTPNRKLRNYILRTIVFTEIIKTVFADYYDYVLKEESEDLIANCGLKIDVSLLNERLHNVIKKSFDNNFNKFVCLCDEFVNKVNNFSAEKYIHCETAVWGCYLKAFLDNISIDTFSYPNQCCLKKEFVDVLIQNFEQFFNIKEIKTSLQSDYNKNVFVESYRLEEKLYKIFDKNVFESYISKYTNNNNLLKTADRLQNACQEAMCDIFMITLYDLSFKDYLNTLFDMLKYKQTSNISLLVQQIRIGMVFDYIVLKYSSVNDLDSIIDSLDLDNNISTEIKKCINKYISYCLCYRTIFKDLFDLSNVALIAANNYDFSEALEVFRRKMSGIIDMTKESALVSTIESLQHQQNYVELKKLINQTCDVSEHKFDLYHYRKSLLENISAQKHVEIMSYRRIVKTLDELIVVLKSQIDVLWDEKSFVDNNRMAPIVYRGHSKLQYILLPLLLRNYKGNVSPRYILEDELEKFKNKAVGYRELNGSHLSDIDFTAYMQHYELGTNLLDWSESVFIAVAFALEKEIKAIAEQKNTVEGELYDACVYMLNVERMNKARDEMIDAYHYKYPEAWSDDEPEKSLKMPHERYPFVSFYDDPQPFNSFFVDSKKTNRYKKCETYQIPVDENDFDPRMYPFAIDVAKNNERIRMQSGCFVVFPLDVRGIPNGNGQFSYDTLSIEKMQEQYEKYKGDEFKPFLVKIIIEKEKRMDIAKALCALGLGIDKVYPELKELSPSINRIISSYYNY